MPLYRCPKCGRTVELPEGTYYCKECGPEYEMVPVSLLNEIEEAKKEQLRDVLIYLNDAVKDLVAFYNKNQDLDFVRKLSFELREFIRAKNELFDKAISLGIISHS